MGVGQSTRSIPDYVYVIIRVNESGYAKVYMFVYNTDNALRLRMFLRSHEDTTALTPCDYWPS